MMKTMTVCLAMIGAVLLGFGLSSVQAAPLVGDSAAGKNKAAMCMGCHGIDDYRTSYPEVYHVPKIGGQNAKYIESALHAYAKGDRKFQTMHAMAASLSDQDIADLAAYYANQVVDSRK